MKHLKAKKNNWNKSYAESILICVGMEFKFALVIGELVEIKNFED